MEMLVDHTNRAGVAGIESGVVGSRAKAVGSQLVRRLLFLASVIAVAWIDSTACAASPAKEVQIAVAVSITGGFESFGPGSLEGAKFAVEEANASGIGPRIELKVYDNASNLEQAKENARQIAASPAVLVVGPSNSVTSIAAGPIYASAGIPAIATTGTSDLITENATTFRNIFKNSEQGELLATYIHRVLGQRRAAVLLMDDGYGRTLEKGFRATAERLGIDATYHVFKAGENLEEKAAAIAPEIANRPVMLAMNDLEGSKILTVLRRSGNEGPFLGSDTFAVESFNARFAGLPEEKDQPGYFSARVYALSPMLLDSANAEMLAFAERFKARLGHNPGWVAVAGYDAARLAIEAVRRMETNAADVASQRAAALKYLLTLQDPRHAPSGLLGPFVFDEERGRLTAVRMGRFVKGRFESAPLQIVPAASPDEAEIQSGAVFELRPGRYARLQQVIYSGLYLNEIMWIDQARFTFAADFYVWLRFAKNTAPGAADPTGIKFPDLSDGYFDREHPVEAREMADGTSYRLWRVKGEFRNPFDLRRYPFDRQTLRMRFFNARAAADQIVYALDQSAADDRMDAQGTTTASGASAQAFDALSQWKFADTQQQRENFVATSTLGDPLRLTRGNYRELSGYGASFDLQRRAIPNLIKNLLPLWLMTCILYASLHFPSVLVQAKIGVAMTAVLTGMVLLNLVNGQLGSIGYTVAVEYAFYIYFGLGLLHIVSVLLAEHLNETGRGALARRTDFWTRVIFLGTLAGMFAMAAALYR